MNLFNKSSEKKQVLQKVDHTSTMHKWDNVDEFCMAIAPIALLIGGALLIILLIYHIAPAFGTAFTTEAHRYEHLAQIVCYVGGI